MQVLEDDPHFNAGRGAVFTWEGRNELDAAIMDGASYMQVLTKIFIPTEKMSVPITFTCGGTPMRDAPYTHPEQLLESRIATSYPESARRYFSGLGGQPEIITISGSVEVAGGHRPALMFQDAALPLRIAKLYEMSADGIAYQYLWPAAVEWNQYAAGFMLYCASTFTLIFAASILNLKKQFPKLFNLLVAAFTFRTIFLIMSLSLTEEWFRFRFIEIIPFAAAFYAAFAEQFGKTPTPSGVGNGAAGAAAAGGGAGGASAVGGVRGARAAHAGAGAAGGGAKGDRPGRPPLGPADTRGGLRRVAARGDGAAAGMAAADALRGAARAGAGDGRPGPASHPHPRRPRPVGAGCGRAGGCLRPPGPLPLRPLRETPFAVASLLKPFSPRRLGIRAILLQRRAECLGGIGECA